MKKGKKNDEKTPLNQKGTLGFYFGSKSKGIALESPDGVQNIDNISQKHESPIEEKQNARETMEVISVPETPITEITTSKLEAKQDEIDRTIGVVSSKVFPLFQKKPKIQLVPDSPVVVVEQIEDSVDENRSTNHENGSCQATETNIVIPSTTVIYICEHDHETEPPPLVVSMLTESVPNVSVAARDMEIDEQIMASEVSGTSAAHVSPSPPIQLTDEQYNPETIPTQPEGLEPEPETDGLHRRSARIRGKQGEIAKRLEEQMKMLESSDDDSTKFIKRGTKNKRGSTTTAAGGTEGEEDIEEAPVVPKKKKVASIFVSKEEKARLAAEEKERKQREAALQEQLRLQQLAEERERRIQEQIRNIKQTNDEMLGAIKSTEASNPFFNVRLNMKPISLLDDSCGSTMNESAESEFARVIEPIPSLSDVQKLLLQLPISRCSVPDRVPAITLIDDYFSGTTLHFDPTALKNASVVDPFLLRSIWLEYVCAISRDNGDKRKTVTIDLETEEERVVTFSQHFLQQQKSLVSWFETWKAKRLSTIENKKSTHRQHFHQNHGLEDDEEFSIADTISEVDSEDDGDCRYRIPATDQEESKNIYVILGKTGSGKTSLVYESAKQVGANVIEINTSQVRSGAVLKKLISEAGQSHHLHSLRETTEDFGSSTTANADSCSKLSVILIDEVDVYFEEEDTGFHSAITKLANSSKIPIILTAEKLPDCLCSLNAYYLYLLPSSISEATSLLQAGGAQQVSLLSTELENLVLASQGDLRASFRELSLLECSYSSSRQHHFTGLSSLSFRNWLLQQSFDFAVFDSLHAHGPAPAEVTSYSSTDYHAFYYPVINSVFPPVIHAKELVTGKEITVHGENFLQSLSGVSNQWGHENAEAGSSSSLAQLVVRIGDHRLTPRIISDTELKIRLPAGDSSFSISTESVLYEIQLEVTFQRGSNSVAISSNNYNYNWLFILVSEIFPVDLSRYLLTNNCKSFSLFKSNEMKAQFFNRTSTETSLPPVVNKGSGKKSSKRKGKLMSFRKKNNDDSINNNNEFSLSSQATTSTNITSDSELEQEGGTGSEMDNNDDDDEIDEVTDQRGISKMKHSGIGGMLLSDDEEEDEQRTSKMERKSIKLEDEDEEEEQIGAVVKENDRDNSVEGEHERTENNDQNEEWNCSPSFQDSEVLPESKDGELDESQADNNEVDILQLLNEVNQQRANNPGSATSRLSIPPIAAGSNNHLSDEWEQLEKYSNCLDHLSSSDCFGTCITSTGGADEEEEDNIVSSSGISRTMKVNSLEVINSYYQEQIKQYAQNDNLTQDAAPSDADASSGPSLDYLSHSFNKHYLVQSRKEELMTFQDFFGIDGKAMFSEYLPFFHLIGKSSILYEEKVKEFQKLLDLERKSMRGRRLQSSANAEGSAEKSAPKYQYLREISRFSEPQLDTLLTVFDNLGSVSGNKNGSFIKV